MKKIISLEISDNLLSEIKAFAEEKQLSISAAIRFAIVEFLSMLKKANENK